MVRPDTFTAVTANPTAVAYAVDRFDAGADALAVSTDVRSRFPQLNPEVGSAVVSQARLRLRGRAKFGSLADRLWFSADGVEQATHPTVAAHRTGRFSTFARVADLGCGIGSDLYALAKAGCAVRGYERDPLTAAIARANLAALGLGADIVERDVETLDPAQLPREFDAAFLDPARRHGGRRTFDVNAYSPPWSYALALLAALPVAVKVAPGIPHEALPAGVEAEWVSLHGELKECAVWSQALATRGVRHRATVLPAGISLTAPSSGSGPDAPVRAPGRYLYEPDPAVIRARLVGTVAGLLGGGLLDATTAYISSDQAVATPFARAFEITDAMPFSLKRLRAVLRERDVGAVTIMKRGSAVDVERLRRDLRLRGTRHQIVVLALVSGRREVLLVEPFAFAVNRD